MAASERLRDIIEPAVRAVGFELWGLEYFSRGRRSLLRVFIDGADGVGVDDCARVSRQISSALDVEDPISGEFTLEVSSPGIDRPLYSFDHYRRYVGFKIKIKLRVPFEGRKTFTGLLNGTDGDDVMLLIEDEEYILPFDSIERANLVGEPD